MSGKLIVGLNPHGDITSLTFPGRVSLRTEDIYFCIDNAFSKAKASAEMVKELVDKDLNKRKYTIKLDGFRKNLKSDVKYSLFKIKQRVESVQCHIPKKISKVEDTTELMEEDIKQEMDTAEENSSEIT